MTRRPLDATPTERFVRRPLGRWRTCEQGRFTWMDEPLLDLVSLPFIPIVALGWRDLVLPDCDLGFLDDQAFERRGIRVGIRGDVRFWELSGTRDHDGGTSGAVHELAPRVPP